MKRAALVLLSLLILSSGCQELPSVSPTSDSDQKLSLAEARRSFRTKILRKDDQREPIQTPPANLFRTIRYASPVGKLAAYVSQPPENGKKYPAIIWIFGGFGNSIDATAWEPALPENDQSASAFQQSGIVMMYPSLRGGNDNPGSKETLFGEVDDILAAADYLAQQDFVDPQRIYLGGHSTGGSLALLVAASTQRFRAVFSFGPVEDVGLYGTESLMFDTSQQREFELRAPIRWLHAIQTPVFIFEGTQRPSNLDSLQELTNTSRNPMLQFYPVQGKDHFSILAPVTPLVADKILQDNASEMKINFTQAELNNLF